MQYQTSEGQWQYVGGIIAILICWSLKDQVAARRGPPRPSRPLQGVYEIDDIPRANIANSRGGFCSMTAAGSVKAGMPIWGGNLSSRAGMIACVISRANLPRDEA
jgi:hypothetical protein